MRIERGISGRMPFAAVGSGPVVVALPGLAPITGVANDALVQSTVSPLARLAASHRIVVLARAERLLEGVSLAPLAAEHAAALEGIVESPVDLVGTSTGRVGSSLAGTHRRSGRGLPLRAQGAERPPGSRHHRGLATGRRRLTLTAGRS